MRHFVAHQCSIILCSRSKYIEIRCSVCSVICDQYTDVSFRSKAPKANKNVPHKRSPPITPQKKSKAKSQKAAAPRKQTPQKTAPANKKISQQSSKHKETPIPSVEFANVAILMDTSISGCHEHAEVAQHVAGHQAAGKNRCRSCSRWHEVHAELEHRTIFNTSDRN